MRSARPSPAGGLRTMAAGLVATVLIAACGTTPGADSAGLVESEQPAATTAADPQDRPAPTLNTGNDNGRPLTPSPPAPTQTPAAPMPQEPVAVRLPTLGLDEPLIPLGIEPDGTMQVPDSGWEVGWFEPGSRIGAPGPTIIAAHVDDRDGPAVFARLVDLNVGDEVVLTGLDGSTARYQVTEAYDRPKDAFPTAAVFGMTGGDELRLITCTGSWDPERASYPNNRIVFATRVD